MCMGALVDWLATSLVFVTQHLGAQLAVTLCCCLSSCTNQLSWQIVVVAHHGAELSSG